MLQSRNEGVPVHPKETNRFSKIGKFFFKDFATFFECSTKIKFVSNCLPKTCYYWFRVIIKPSYISIVVEKHVEIRSHVENSII